jgi:eukaryotic-like serine/threonine-protein kinase
VAPFAFRIPGMDSIPFPAQRFSLGATPNCQVRLPAGDVGDCVAEIVEVSGKWSVSILSGSLPLVVDGKRVTAAPLVLYSRLTLGRLTLEVVSDSANASHEEPATLASAPAVAHTTLMPAQSDLGATAMVPAIASTPLDELASGEVIDGRYAIVRAMARGGMGEVFLCKHLTLKREVALKVMLKEFSQDTVMINRFKREAMAASAIGHENIVTILDSGQLPSGRFYFVMELVDGVNLKEALRKGAFPWRRTAAIVSQIAKALGAAHDKKIVHRDVKPDNFMLMQRGGTDFVKVLDFGVAKQTTPSGTAGHTVLGQVFGSPRYMSPEGVSGKGVDWRTDIYSLGLVLYELLTGKAACQGETVPEMMAQHMFAEIPKALSPHGEVPVELQGLLQQMTSKDPEVRLQSMHQVSAVLDTLLFAPRPSRPPLANQQTVVRMPATPLPPMPRPEPLATHSTLKPSGNTEKKLLIAAVASLALAVIALTAVLVFRTRTPDFAPPVVAVVSKQQAPVATVPAKDILVTLILESSPTKAEVYSGDVLLGNTPLRLTHKIYDEVSFRFVLVGHQELVKRVRFETPGTLRAEMIPNPKPVSERKKIQKSPIDSESTKDSELKDPFQ